MLVKTLDDILKEFGAKLGSISPSMKTAHAK